MSVNKGLTTRVTKPAGAFCPVPKVALITVVPARLPVAVPLEATLAMPVFDEAHFTVVVISGGGLPSLIVPVAAN
jgi:hypothetical protein